MAASRVVRKRRAATGVLGSRVEPGGAPACATSLSSATSSGMSLGALEASALARERRPLPVMSVPAEARPRFEVRPLRFSLQGLAGGPGPGGRNGKLPGDGQPRLVLGVRSSDAAAPASIDRFDQDASSFRSIIVDRVQSTGSSLRPRGTERLVIPRSSLVCGDLHCHDGGGHHLRVRLGAMGLDLCLGRSGLSMRFVAKYCQRRRR